MLKVIVLATSSILLAVSSYADTTTAAQSAAKTVKVSDAKKSTKQAPQKVHKKAAKKKKQASAMIYYQALQKCQKGFYSFPNPVFAKQVDSKQVIEANILGNVGGFCHVNLYFDNAKDRLSCLLTVKMRTALGTDANTLAFKQAYTQGYFDTGKVTQYDKTIHEACESF